MQYWNIYL